MKPNHIFETHTMSDESSSVSADVRNMASVVLECLDDIADSREKSLAITKLEECVMWANKALALHGIKR